MQSAPLSDADCIRFLQWALPLRSLRWPGFRKVRRQVCKRVGQRVRELGLARLDDYRTRLEADPAEWQTFDECCHITISRFFRDRGVFAALRTHVLPNIAARAKREGRSAYIWSAGCASGEEPYTLKVIWDLEISDSYPNVPLTIVATDIDSTMLQRANEACFGATSLHELPPELVARAFDRVGTKFCLRQRHREGVDFQRQDLTAQAPLQRFDLILCRYVAFTYFSLPLQEQVLARLVERLLSGGFLVIGNHERLPPDGGRLTPLPGLPQVLQRHADRPGTGLR